MPTEVTAYALRWGVRIPGVDDRGEPCWTVVPRAGGVEERTLDSTGEPVPVVVNHARALDTDKREPALATPVGHFVEFHSDSVGLWTRAIYEDSPLTQQTLALIRSGDITSYSVSGKPGWTEQRGREQGHPVYEVHRMVVREAGPTPNPADPGARILTVDDLPAISPERNLAAILAEVEQVTGISRRAALLDVSIANHAAQRRTSDRVREIKSVAFAYHRAKDRAAILQAELAEPGRPAGTGDLWFEAQRAAKGYRAELTAMLCNDQTLLNEVLERFRPREQGWPRSW